MLAQGSVTAPPGPAWCRAWTGEVDDAVAGWLAEVPPRRAVAVVALGSYARREVCPSSDIDVLLLHDGWHTRDLESLVTALCYPLWDAGLSVGHAVRTPRECVEAAGERIDTATALVERRLVAGDRGLFDDLASRTARWLRRSGPAILQQLAEEDARRHARAGDVAGCLEPDLKDGAGGLRDLHSLRWAAACLLGEPGLDPLVGARYLGAADRRDLAEARDTLLTARCALHLVAGRRGGSGQDRLRLDLQDDVAARLGTDADDLLQRVGLATRTVAHVHGRTSPLLQADARGGRRRRKPPPQLLGRGVVLRDGLVEIDGGHPLDGDPAVGLRAVAAAAVHGVHLGRAAAERLRRGVADAGQLGWDAESRELLLSILRSGRAGAAALEDADHLGLLTAHLPEWARVRGRPQRNPLHRYDLDTHARRTVVELDDVARGRFDDAHAALFRGLARPDHLRLAALLHDVGKAWPGDHSEAGAVVADRWLTDMGFSSDVGVHVARLVRHHLLLPEAATGRDIDDEDELAAVAEAVGDVETLDQLYLLSLADGRATGPAAWSTWKERLLAELHGRVRRVLSAERALVPVATEEALDHVLGGLVHRYRREACAAQAAEHARLLTPLPGLRELRASVRPGPAGGTSTVSVVARDRCGLLADCAGVLAGHGLRVIDARAFTGAPPGQDTQVALDWFVVEPDEPVTWSTVAADLERVGRAAVDVDALLRRRASRRRGQDPTVPVQVRVELGAARPRIEVRAPDRIGLLHRLARVLAEAGLDVLGARVTTLGPEVRDVFFLDAPPEDPAALTRILTAAAAPDAGDG